MSVIIDGIDVSIPVKLRPNRTDLTGKKFGKLTVIKPVISAKIGRKTHTRWLCQCECGNYKVVYTYSLLSGNTRSCGCLVHKPNTYVKRLQAENERLKEELRTEKIYSSQIEELEKSLQHAKAENKELSESIKRLKNMAKAAALGREKYSRALQEIRDVILSPEVIDEETKKLHTSEELDNIVRWHREDKLIKIKAKINEVIGVE